MNISELAKRYSKFHGEVGMGITDDWVNEIPLLFDAQLKKFGNGKELVSNLAQFKSHMEELKTIGGSWQVIAKELIPSREETSCTMRYQLVTEKAGTFEVATIIKMSKNNLIAIIDTVYSVITTNLEFIKEGFQEKI